MTRHDRQSERMVEWLLTGPYDVPAAPLEAAVAYARAHPRERRVLRSLWRRLTNWKNAIEVSSDGERRAFSGGFAMAALAAVAIVAIAGWAAVLVRGPEQMGGGPLASPSITPPATPVETRADTSRLPVPAEVRITSQCVTSRDGTESLAGDVTRYRMVVLRCTATTSDPRVAGPMDVEMSIDRRADGSADIWGTSDITTPGGTWHGGWRGTVDVGYTTHRMTGVYVGAGEYEGLRIRWRQISIEAGYELTGTIERVETIPPDGSITTNWATCHTVGAGTEVQAGDVTQVRDLVFACAGGVADPRLAGTELVTINIEQRADLSADLWGTATLDVGSGRWGGSWTGTVDVGYTTHRMAGVYTGSGAFAGLEFRWTQIGEDPYIYSGTIDPAGQ